MMYGRGVRRPEGTAGSWARLWLWHSVISDVGPDERREYRLAAGDRAAEQHRSVVAGPRDPIGVPEYVADQRDVRFARSPGFASTDATSSSSDTGRSSASGARSAMELPPERDGRLIARVVPAVLAVGGVGQGVTRLHLVLFARHLDGQRASQEQQQ